MGRREQRSRNKVINIVWIDRRGLDIGATRATGRVTTTYWSSSELWSCHRNHLNVTNRRGTLRSSLQIVRVLTRNTKHGITTGRVDQTSTQPQPVERNYSAVGPESHAFFELCCASAYTPSILIARRCGRNPHPCDKAPVSRRCV